MGSYEPSVVALNVGQRRRQVSPVHIDPQRSGALAVPFQSRERHPYSRHSLLIVIFL
jgi:hypothetical protein